MRRHDALRAMGALRLGVGASLVVAPRWAGRIWVGDDAGGHGTKVFARALGARDLVLGAAALQRLGAGDDGGAARLTQLGVAADGADLLATLLAGRNLSGPRRWLMPLVAAGVGALGASTWMLAEEVVEEAERDEHPAGFGEPTPVVGGRGIGLDEQRRATLGATAIESVTG